MVFRSVLVHLPLHGGITIWNPWSNKSYANLDLVLLFFSIVLNLSSWAPQQIKKMSLFTSISKKTKTHQPCKSFLLCMIKAHKFLSLLKFLKRLIFQMELLNKDPHWLDLDLNDQKTRHNFWWSFWIIIDCLKLIQPFSVIFYERKWRATLTGHGQSSQ